MSLLYTYCSLKVEERFDLDGHELVLRFPNDDEAQVVLDVFKKSPTLDGRVYNVC